MNKFDYIISFLCSIDKTFEEKYNNVLEMIKNKDSSMCVEIKGINPLEDTDLQLSYNDKIHTIITIKKDKIETVFTVANVRDKIKRLPNSMSYVLAEFETKKKGLIGTRNKKYVCRVANIDGELEYISFEEGPIVGNVITEEAVNAEDLENLTKNEVDIVKV